MAARLWTKWRREVAARLKRARRNAGLWGRELAERAGLCLETVRRIEQGRNTPDLATLLLWCQVCEIDPFIILEGLSAPIGANSTIEVR